MVETKRDVSTCVCVYVRKDIVGPQEILKESRNVPYIYTNRTFF